MTLLWIIAGGVLMSLIALVGALTLVLSEAALGRVLRPLVAFAAGALLGGLVAYAASTRVEVQWLVPLAAGNFLYIGASDLVPEVNKGHDLGASAAHFGAFVAGLGLLYALAGER